MALIRVLVNGRDEALAPGTTVAALVARIAAERTGIAVAVDGEVVPRSEWAAHRVDEGACVEIVTAAQGG